MIISALNILSSSNITDNMYYHKRRTYRNLKRIDGSVEFLQDVANLPSAAPSLLNLEHENALKNKPLLRAAAPRPFPLHNIFQWVHFNAIRCSFSHNHHHIIYENMPSYGRCDYSHHPRWAKAIWILDGRASRWPWWFVVKIISPRKERRGAFVWDMPDRKMSRRKQIIRSLVIGLIKIDRALYYRL